MPSTASTALRMRTNLSQVGRDACSRRGRLVHHLRLAAWVWPKADPGSSGDVPCTAWRLTSAHGVRHDGGMGRCGEDVRGALVRQWEAIAAAVATVDLEIPSRVTGWRNREVVAHLCLQPALLRRFVAAASRRDAVAGVAANLAGTRSLAGLIDASARQAAEAGRVDFARAVEAALPSLRAADLSATGSRPGPARGSSAQPGDVFRTGPVRPRVPIRCHQPARQEAVLSWNGPPRL